MAEEIRQGDIPGVQLRCRQQMPAPVSTVWSWLTEAEHLSKWLCERARYDDGDNLILILESGGGDAETVRERMTTVEAVPQRRWLIAFQRLDADWPTTTRVVIELAPSTDGTEVSVLQNGFAHLPLSACLTIWETYRRRWRTALARLASQLGEVPPDQL